MTQVEMLRERGLWIAAVAVLVTSTAWLALVTTALLLRGSALEPSAAFVAGRALVRVALLLVRHSWRILPTVLLVPALLALLVSGLRAGAPRGGRIAS